MMHVYISQAAEMADGVCNHKVFRGGVNSVRKHLTDSRPSQSSPVMMSHKHSERVPEPVFVAGVCTHIVIFVECVQPCTCYVALNTERERWRTCQIFSLLHSCREIFGMVVSTTIDEEPQDVDGQREQCRKVMAISQHSGALGVAQYDLETQVVRFTRLYLVYGDTNAPELRVC
jgi:hypothetical protein